MGSDWIKAVSRGFLGGKQLTKAANTSNRARPRLFILKNKTWRTCHVKEGNSKIWAMAIVVSLLGTTRTVDVPTVKQE